MKNNTYYFKRNITKLFRAILLLIIIALQACDNDTTPTVNPYDYYPFSIGKFIIYQVNEVIYSSGQKDSIVNSYQEKDEFVSLTTDKLGIETYTIWRFVRSNDAQYWQKSKEFKIQRVPDKIIIDIDNETYVPLIFPIDQNVQWNAFMYFNLSDKDYRYGYKSSYQEIGQPLSIGNQTFKNTIKVQERLDTTGLIKYNLSVKHYAEGIGLISEKEADFEYLQNNGELEGYKIIASGKRRNRIIISHGQN